MNSFSRVVGWSFIHFLDPQCPRSIHFHNISDVTIFAALTLSLRSNPLSLVVRLPLMRNRHLYYQEKGVDSVPLTIWMVNQASQSSVHAGLKAWVHNLLPLLLVDNSQKTHQWTELILDIVEKILAKPGTLEELVGSPSWESHVVIPITSLKTMLRVRFPATEEEDTTRRFMEIYHSLKQVALAGAQLRMDRFERKSWCSQGSYSNRYLVSEDQYIKRMSASSTGTVA
ncbi:uncharacterized protein LOC125585485 isoform X1 [Brassica napus]|uniref:uncharacterized protein LOC125585485 isoform X1 n=1 Tax=Brassica napus TaxID=3708 RepID=UPI00207A4673|nr:uncharacterized protein LOC125585485 isoform X1 [Brassica napus]